MVGTAEIIQLDLQESEMTIAEMITGIIKSPQDVEAPVVEEKLRDDGREVVEAAAVEAAIRGREAARRTVTWAGGKTTPRGCDHKARPLEVAEAPILEAPVLREAEDAEIEIAARPLIAIAAAQGRSRLNWNYSVNKIRQYLLRFGSKLLRLPMLLNFILACTNDRGGSVFPINQSSAREARIRISVANRARSGARNGSRKMGVKMRSI